MSRTIHIKTITKEELFDAKKPRFNAHIGTGIHTSKKVYNRKKKHKHRRDDESR